MTDEEWEAWFAALAEKYPDPVIPAARDGRRAVVLPPRAVLSEQIRTPADGGRDDPTIAYLLGISVRTVRRIRREDSTPAGERTNPEEKP